MKKLAESIKRKNLLAILIMLGVYVLFSFVYTIWYESSASSFALSAWIMFLVNSGLVTMIVLGIFLRKREFVLVPFVILGVTTLYGSISDVSGITSFFSDFKNLASNVSYYKGLGFSVRVNVPVIFADFIRGHIGLAGLGVFVLFMLGKVVLKNEKLTKIGHIILSLIPVAVLVYGLFAMISSICYSAWEGDNNIVILLGQYASYTFVYSISKAALWATLACVSAMGLPEKGEKAVAKEEPVEQKAEEQEEKEEPAEQKSEPQTESEAQ